MLRRNFNVFAVPILSVLFIITLPEVRGLYYSRLSTEIAPAQGLANNILSFASFSQPKDSSQVTTLLLSGNQDDPQRVGTSPSQRSPRPESEEAGAQPKLIGPAAQPTQVASPTVNISQTTPSPSPAQASGQTEPTPTPSLTAIPAPPPPPPANPDPKRIALQAGHWKYQEAPYPLNRMTGTAGGGKNEPEITLAIANETAKILRGWGDTVEILPVVIPANLKADLFVAIHADGSSSSSPRGFFTDRPQGSPVSAKESKLSTSIDSEYAKATGIPYVNRSTADSRYYYAFREIESSIPIVLIETGFLTNAMDQEILIRQPQRAAEGIANGIMKYLGR